MSRLMQARRRRQWEARGLPMGMSPGQPEPVNWGKVVGYALLGGAAYFALKDHGAAHVAPTPTAPENTFVFAQVRQPASLLDQVMDWTTSHQPHLVAAAAGIELLKDPALLQRTLVAAAQPRALAPPVAQSVARPVIRTIATPIEPVRIAPQETPAAGWSPPLDHQWLALAPHPSVTVIVGPRGCGKSHLGHRLLEQLRVHADPFVLGPASLRSLLPREIGAAQRLEDIPPRAAVLIDEAYAAFGARNSMTASGRGIGELVNLSRQRGWSLIFVTQDSRQLDVNVLSQADVIAIKGVNEIGRAFERREIRPHTDRAAAAFASIQGDRRPWTWVYSAKTGFSGLVRHEPASYWRPALSNAYAGRMSVGDESKPKATAPRYGARLSKDEVRARARGLVLVQGKSYGEAAAILDLPKSTVWDLVNDK